MRHIWTYATADAACREDALSFEDLSLSLSQTMNIHGPIWAALRLNASQSLLPPLVILCMCHSIICFWCLSLSVSLSSVCVCVCVCAVYWGKTVRSLFSCPLSVFRLVSPVLLMTETNTCVTSWLTQLFPIHLFYIKCRFMRFHRWC